MTEKIMKWAAGLASALMIALGAATSALADSNDGGSLQYRFLNTGEAQQTAAPVVATTTALKHQAKAPRSKTVRASTMHSPL
jgi:hypothetical protein